MTWTQRRNRWSRAVLGTGVLLGLLLTGACAPDGVIFDSEPQTKDLSLPVADQSQLQVPNAFDRHVVVDPDWTQLPLMGEGVFVGTRVGDEVTTIEVVNALGTLLWTLERPTDCFELDLSQSSASVVVVKDRDTCGTQEPVRKVTGYDVGTGNRVWGPVEVQGQPHGSGLVFQTDDNARVVLDGNSGELIEHPFLSGGELLAERNGMVAVAEQEGLSVFNAQGSQVLWTTDYGQLGWTKDQLIETSSVLVTDLAVVISGETVGVTLLALESGEVLSTSLKEQVPDLVTQSLIVLDEQGLHSFDSEANARWSHSVSPKTTISAAGGALIYLRDDQAVRVLNTITGAVAEGYTPGGSGTIVVPGQIRESLEAILWAGPKVLLALPQD